MHVPKSKFSSAGAAACGALLLMAASLVPAQPALVALVLGNGNYSAFPALPACLSSSRKVGDTLRDLGYRVVERQDITSGGMAAAIGEFSRGMEAAPSASVLVYVCGYAAGMNDRAFLLPVSANIRRPSDVMTQGILAKALLDVLARGKPSRGLVALDLVKAPEVAAPVLASLTEVPAPEGVALIAVTGPPPPAGSTPLSVAFSAGAAVPAVRSDSLLNSIESQLRADPTARIGAMRMPSASYPLMADEQPPPQPVPIRPELAQPEKPVELAADDTQVAAEDAAPPPSFPDQGTMSGSERRRVQEALARLGYYSGGIDGIFGPETHAAIRRFQHEIGAEMTGVITGAQATRLVNWQ